MLVYHYTTKENLPSILANGLKPNTFVVQRQTDWGGEVLLEITLDESYSWGVKPDLNDNWQRVLFEQIDPKKIKVIEKEYSNKAKWAPLPELPELRAAIEGQK